MANTIRLKRGSGSDPGTSDLVVGEVAVRTDNGKLFTKKDDGTIAEISGSGGGGISDGDKGDITVSNSGDTFTIDNGVVTSAKIADGTIVNADINASAAIEGSKIQAAGLFNSGVMTAAQHNKLGGIEANATADMTGTEILATISGENIILGEISSTGNSTFAGNVTISSSDGGSAAAPELELSRDSASPADADYLGQIKFTGESDDDSKEVYAKITGKIGDASSGTEDGILEIAHRKAGSNNISARFTSTDLKLINGTGLEVAGDTETTGDIKVNSISKSVQVGDISGDNYLQLIQLESTSTKRGFTTQHNSATVLENLQGNTTEHLVLGDTSNNNSGTIFGISHSQSGASHVIKLNLTGQGDLDVQRNITLGGTVDGVDIAARDTLFGGLTSSSGVLSNGVTATTQGSSDNTTKVATTAYVTTAISNLINNAPSALDTLKELSDALGSDANFSTTVTNSLATKLPLAGGTLTGNLAINTGNSTNDLSATNIFRIMGNDVRITNAAGSEGMIFAAADGAVSLFHGMGSGTSAETKLATTTTGVSVTGRIFGDTMSLGGTGTTYDALFQFSNNTAYSTSGTNAKVAIGNANSTAATNSTGIHMFTDGNGRGIVNLNACNNSTNASADFVVQTRHSGTLGERLRIKSEGTVDIAGNLDVGAGIDVTDGDITLASGHTVDGRDVSADGTKLDGIENNATADQTASEILTLIKTVDGAGSGLDADTLDGIGSSAFVRGDSTDNGLISIRANDNDFIVQDSTDAITNFIWRDHSANLLYLGTTNAVITPRSHIVPNSDSSYNIGSSSVRFANGFFDTLYGSGANLTNLPSQTDNNFTDADHSKLDGIEAGATADQTKSDIDALGIAASTAATLATARTIAGVSFDGSANISLNNNAITNGAGYITSSNAAITNKLPLAGGTLTGDLTISNSAPKILLTDTNNNPDYQLKNFNGVFELDQGTSDTKFKITTDGHVEFPNDDQEIRIGQGSDLILLYDGSNSIIKNAGTGNLKLQVDGSTKLEITSAGATLTGDAAVSGSVTAPRISGSNGIIEMKAEIGTSQTLTTGYNAIAVDPTVANGVTITVPSGATWSIV